MALLNISTEDPSYSSENDLDVTTVSIEEHNITHDIQNEPKQNPPIEKKFPKKKTYM